MAGRDGRAPPRVRIEEMVEVRPARARSIDREADVYDVGEEELDEMDLQEMVEMLEIGMDCDVADTLDELFPHRLHPFLLQAMLWEFDPGFLQAALRDTAALLKVPPADRPMTHYAAWRRMARVEEPLPWPKNVVRVRVQLSAAMAKDAEARGEAAPALLAEHMGEVMDLLLYYCVFQSCAIVRALGTNMMWMIYHVMRKYCIEQWQGLSLSTLQSGLSVNAELAASDPSPSHGSKVKTSPRSSRSVRKAVSAPHKTSGSWVGMDVGDEDVAVGGAGGGAAPDGAEEEIAVRTMKKRSSSRTRSIRQSQKLVMDPVGLVLKELDWEMDAFMHVNYDVAVLNRFCIQHDDIEALCMTPEFVARYQAQCAAGNHSLAHVFVADEARYPIQSQLYSFQRDPILLRNAMPRSKGGFDGDVRCMNGDEKKAFAAYFGKQELADKEVQAEELWKDLCKEVLRVCDDWKCHRDMNGGPFGIYCYLTIMASIWPVIVWNVGLVSLCIWWVFGFATDGFLLVLPIWFLLTVVFCVLLRWLWLPLSDRRVPALGNARVPWETEYAGRGACEIQDRSVPWLITYWIGMFALMMVVSKYLAFDHLRKSTLDLLSRLDDRPFLALLRIVLHWAPAIVVALIITQFFATGLMGLHSFLIALFIGAKRFRWWRDVKKKPLRMALRRVARKLCPNLRDADKDTLLMAGAHVWNNVVHDLYTSDLVTQQEKTALYFIMDGGVSVQEMESGEFCGEKLTCGTIVREPALSEVKHLKCARAKEMLLEFLNMCMLESLPEALMFLDTPSYTRAMPVGGSEPIYPSWNELTRPRNTDTSLLRHLLLLYKHEFDCFIERRYPAKENAAVNKALYEMKTRVLKRFIAMDDVDDEVKVEICKWAALRVVCTYRNLIGQTRANQSLFLITLLQYPRMTVEEAAEAVRQRAKLVVGFQGYKEVPPKERTRKDPKAVGSVFSKDDNGNLKSLLRMLDERLIVESDVFSGQDAPQDDGADGEHADSDALRVEMAIQREETLASIAAVRVASAHRTGAFEFVYQWQDSSTKCYYAKAIDSYFKTGVVRGPISGTFSTVGFGKPWNQNCMLAYCTQSDAIQMLDCNQDMNPGFGFFVPSVLRAFKDDPTMHLLAGNDSVMNMDWNLIAYGSSLSQRAFASLSQRMMALQQVRFHYGHTDIVRSSFAIGASGLSKANILSEDVTLGMSVVARGGRVAWVDYYHVGKAKDTDLMAQTKFERKVASGCPQVACSWLWWQLCLAPHYCGFNWRHPLRGIVNLLRRMSMYYTIVGWYLNHTVLAYSVYVLSISLVLLIGIDMFVEVISSYSYDIARTFVYIHLGTVLFFPGLLQVLLDSGFVVGFFQYIVRAIPLAIIGMYHILNTAVFFHRSTRVAPIYRFSGRGDGLSHVGFTINWITLRESHWTPGLVLLYTGAFVLLDQKYLLAIIVSFIPASVWLAAPILLDQGTAGADMTVRGWWRLLVIDTVEYIGSVRREFLDNRDVLVSKWRKHTGAGKLLALWDGLVFVVWTVWTFFIAFNLLLVLVIAFIPGTIFLLCRSAYQVLLRAPLRVCVRKYREMRGQEVKKGVVIVDETPTTTAAMPPLITPRTPTAVSDTTLSAPEVDELAPGEFASIRSFWTAIRDVEGAVSARQGRMQTQMGERDDTMLDMLSGRGTRGTDTFRTIISPRDDTGSLSPLGSGAGSDPPVNLISPDALRARVRRNRNLAEVRELRGFNRAMMMARTQSPLSGRAQAPRRRPADGSVSPQEAAMRSDVTLLQAMMRGRARRGAAVMSEGSTPERRLGAHPMSRREPSGLAMSVSSRDEDAEDRRLLSEARREVIVDVDALSARDVVDMEAIEEHARENMAEMVDVAPVDTGRRRSLAPSGVRASRRRASLMMAMARERLGDGGDGHESGASSAREGISYRRTSLLPTEVDEHALAALVAKYASDEEGNGGDGSPREDDVQSEDDGSEDEAGDV